MIDVVDVALFAASAPVRISHEVFSSAAATGEVVRRRARTAAMVAAQHGAVGVLRYLLDQGADPNCAPDEQDKYTALHCAAASARAPFPLDTNRVRGSIAAPAGTVAGFRAWGVRFRV